MPDASCALRQVSAVVARGHGVASGRSTVDTRFPRGTIRMQLPFFAARGLDLDAYFSGNFLAATLNLDLSPHRVQILQPEFFLSSVAWTDLMPAENFYLSAAQISFGERLYKAMLYIPDPATKPDHFQPPTIVEAIAEPIACLSYGDAVALHYHPAAIQLVQ
ncbi:MAG: hypothetical protein WBP90_15765 [Terracidiphilus sp.]